jgi:hypothetical protein
VAKAIRSLHEASINVGLGEFFGPCSLVLCTSSSSLIVASIAACRAAYGDKGGLSVLSYKVQNVPLPKDGVEGIVVEGLSEAWIEQAGDSLTEVVDVITVGHRSSCCVCPWEGSRHQGCRSSFVAGAM